MDSINREALKPWARKYLWWKTPEQAMRQPLRVVAQVMDIGDYADVQRLVREVGEGPLKQAISRAEAGYFNARSWAYWHYRLGLSQPGQVPPRPQRNIR